MSLKRDRIIGYNNDRMMFEFTMMTPDARIVACQISSVAMDQMDGGRTPSSERDAQFIRLRDAIEKIASDRFGDNGTTQGAVVCIYQKHLPENGPDRRVYADGRWLRFRCFESAGRAPESLLNVSLIPCRPVAESYRLTALGPFLPRQRAIEVA
jgi:hypothetical protein